jgi:hypothetical protein
MSPIGVLWWSISSNARLIAHTLPREEGSGHNSPVLGRERVLYFRERTRAESV